MDEKKKNLCAMIPESLHIRVREEQEQLALTLSEYVEKIIREHFEGGKSAPVKAEKKSAARKQPVKSAPPRKTFLDMIAPGVLKFNPDVYIRDNLYCCVWALKEYGT